MLVLIVIAAIVVLVGVVLVAMGRGGELSVERSDYAPLELGPVTATDVVLLRPSENVWGYNVQETNQALERIAESIRERDVRIVALEQLVTDLSREPVPPLAALYTGARHRRETPGSGPLPTSAWQAEPESGNAWQGGSESENAWGTGLASGEEWQAGPESGEASQAEPEPTTDSQQPPEQTTGTQQPPEPTTDSQRSPEQTTELPASPPERSHD